MRGESFLVVKAYEECMHGSTQTIAAIVPKVADPTLDAVECQANLQTAGMFSAAQPRGADEIARLQLQDPRFLPHSETPMLPKVSPPCELKFVAPGGTSRWESDPGLKVCGFTIVTERGETNQLVSMLPAKFIVNVVAELDGVFDYRYGVVFFDHTGACIAKIISPSDSFSLKRGETRCVEMLLNPNQLGPGEYVLSVSLHAVDVLEKFNSTPRFDLLNRSFGLNVELPEALSALTTNFFHSAEWGFA